MKITFIGAAHEVTGSCTLIEVGDKKGIVDFGMEQGKDIFVNQGLPISPAELDFVLVTHAHVDHSGRLPLLYKNGFKGPVYATSATCSLLDIMLRDCGHIQMSDAEWKSRKAERKGEPPVEPLYDLNDVDGLLKCLRPCSYGTVIQLNDAVSVRFTDVGHLLGSAAIEIWLTEKGTEKKIVFSGDLGNTNQPILVDPKAVESADYLVIESTYGDRNHEGEHPDYVANLAEIIQRTFNRGGNVVIPSFAVGRTQEMLYFIREIKEKGLVKGHPGFPVYVDSPLAIEATGIFLQCDTSFVDEEMKAVLQRGVNPIFFEGLETAVSQEESKAINENKSPKVIISASGMCDAGRVRHHLKHNLWRRESTVLFVGYQSAGTLGRLLNDGIKKVKLFGEDINVNCEILALPGVSGHADRDGLIAWLKGFSEKPGRVFVNHGDPESCEAFVSAISAMGYNAYAPYSGTVYDLAEDALVYEAEGVPIEKNGGKKINPLFTQLVAAAENLLNAVKKCDGWPNKELRIIIDQINKITGKIER